MRENESLMGMLPKRIMQILAITVLAILIDFVPVVFLNTSPILIGESVEVAGAVLAGPLVGGIAAFIKCIATDYWIYGTFDYIATDLTEALAVFLIGTLYRKLCPDSEHFGVKEIAVFNFTQVIVNIGMFYFLTPPITVLFLDELVVSWEKEAVAVEMNWLLNDTFTACVSTALLGTLFIAFAKIMGRRRKLAANGGKLLPKNTFIRDAYSFRAAEYSAGIFIAIVVGLVDSILSGHLLGKEALSAISVTIPLVALTEFFSRICANGCTTMCSMAHGNKEYERANRYFTQGLILTVLLGLLQTAGFWALKDFYFGFFNPAAPIRALAEEYYNYFIFIPPILGITTFLDEVVSSDGDDGLANYGYLASFALNLVCSYFLTKSMGIRGLALGTIIAYSGYALLECAHFLKKSNTYHLRFGSSVKDIPLFFKYSLSNSFPVLCKALVSTAFTKAIIMVLGSEYLIANTVLCAMLEVYEMVNGPSEAAYYMMSTYSGEKNGRGLKEVFSYAMWVCLGMGFIIFMLIMGVPELVLYLFDISDSPLHDELISCIRYCSMGITAAAFTGFLNDYYGATGKSYWAALVVILRTMLLPVFFAVTFCVSDGIEGMGKGMLLAQVTAIAIFFGLMVIVRGSEDVPYMIPEEEWKNVRSRSFAFEKEEYGELLGWLRAELEAAGTDSARIARAEELLNSLYRKTLENNPKKRVLGECVLDILERPVISIKDNGKLFEPLKGEENTEYNVLLTANCNTLFL